MAGQQLPDDRRLWVAPVIRFRFGLADAQRTRSCAGSRTRAFAENDQDSTDHRHHEACVEPHPVASHEASRDEVESLADPDRPTSTKITPRTTDAVCTGLDGMVYSYRYSDERHPRFASESLTTVGRAVAPAKKRMLWQHIEAANTATTPR